MRTVVDAPNYKHLQHASFFIAMKQNTLLADRMYG